MVVASLPAYGVAPSEVLDPLHGGDASLLDEQTGLALVGRRVAILNWREPGQSVAGGAEVYAWNAAKALVTAGAYVDFYSSREPGQPKRSVVDGITIYRQGGFYDVYARTALKVWRRRRHYDLVIDAENGVPFFAPLYLRSVPVVLLLHHVHQDQFGVHMGPLHTFVARFIEGRLMPWAYSRHEAIAVSPSTRDSMRRRLGWRGPIDVIENGSPSPRPHRAQDPTAVLRVCALGRLVAHKRVDRVIEAVCQLHARGVPVHLDVVGRGYDEEILNDLVRARGAEELVTMHGFLDEERKIEVLQSADVHVCWSDGEGWGQVVLEAAAVGVPTIGRRVTGLQDAIVDGVTGWLVDDIDGLADALQAVRSRLADPQQRAELAAECRMRAYDFSWPRMQRAVREYVAARLITSAD